MPPSEDPMMQAGFEEQVRMVIAHHLQKHADQIEMTHSLRRDLGFNNLSLIGLVLELEEIRQCEVPIELLESVDTVRDLIAFFVVQSSRQLRDARRRVINDRGRSWSLWQRWRSNH